MEWLLLPALGITIWLLSRSLQQEQQLDALKRRLQQAEETSVNQAARASGEAERLRSQVLELLRAHSQLQRRISDLQEAFNAEPARPPPEATTAAAPPHLEPDAAPPRTAPEMAPDPESSRNLADAAFAAAEAAGLADPVAHAEPAPQTPNVWTNRRPTSRQPDLSLRWHRSDPGSSLLAAAKPPSGRP
jgi:uncharacterized membrane protein YccC